MSKLASYINEFVSFIVMILLLAALVSGQLYAKSDMMASAGNDAAEIRHAGLDRD